MFSLSIMEQSPSYTNVKSITIFNKKLYKRLDLWERFNDNDHDNVNDNDNDYDNDNDDKGADHHG